MLIRKLLCFYNGSPCLFKNYTKLYKKPPLCDSWGNFLIFLRTWPHNTFTYRHHYIIAYTSDKHYRINGIPLLLEWWKWHCYSHPNYLCLNIHQITFYYSTLKAHISTNKNDRNKQISDIQSRHLEDYIWL